VFVDQYRPYEAISGEVKFKLNRLKQYGTGKLILHALGRENVLRVLRLKEEFETEIKEDQIEANKKLTIITAMFIF